MMRKAIRIEVPADRIKVIKPVLTQGNQVNDFR